MNNSYPIKTTRSQRDRIAGVLVGMAAGDALGAPHEFRPAQPLLNPEMTGGGAFGWEAGEWTDDTSMAIVIAKAAMQGRDLRHAKVQDRIARGWVEWATEAKDVGVQTSSILWSIADEPSAKAILLAARDYHDKRGRSGGNGSLMRTAPVALRYLHAPKALAAAARAVSNLTHYDTDAGDACVLWSLAIRHAILFGEFDLRGGVEFLPARRRALWSDRITEAETHAPSYFTNNGWVVGAMQGAWSAIIRTEVPEDMPADHLRLALVEAVRGGKDTDTVAAIAGSLLGARWGVSAVPLSWQRVLHGWPGLRGSDLMRLGLLVASGASPDSNVWPAAARMNYGPDMGADFAKARHPFDSGVWLGGADVLEKTTPRDVTAIVSLCRIGHKERPKWVNPANHVEVWLLDESGEDTNLNLDFVLAEAAQAVADLRAEGHTVLLHCVAAYSRTPTVAALYANQYLDIPMHEALESIVEEVGWGNPRREFREALARLAA